MFHNVKELNMDHLFIPYNLAVLAKEKGYNEKDFAYYALTLNEGCEPYTEVGIKFFHDYNYNHNFRIESHKRGYEIICTAPLYQQIIDWFREKRNLIITVTNFPTTEDTVDYDYCICNSDQDIDERGNAVYIVDYDVNRSFSYYEAFNEAIFAAFKLI